MNEPIELYMCQRRGGNKQGAYPGQVNKGTRFYKDLRGVRTFVRACGNTPVDVYKIVGKATYVPPEQLEEYQTYR